MPNLRLYHIAITADENGNLLPQTLKVTDGVFEAHLVTGIEEMKDSMNRDESPESQQETADWLQAKYGGLVKVEAALNAARQKHAEAEAAKQKAEADRAQAEQDARDRQAAKEAERLAKQQAIAEAGDPFDMKSNGDSPESEG